MALGKALRPRRPCIANHCNPWLLANGMPPACPAFSWLAGGRHAVEPGGPGPLDRFTI
jgi:hypothetical protein